MIQSDKPIISQDQDKLGRARSAQVIANEIRNIDPNHGTVIGILGAWGSGKTSLINMIRNQLDEKPAYPVVDFNPWLFSGTDELVRSFFSEISEQLRLGTGKLDSIADQLEHYGDVVAPLQVLPVVGAWIERASGAGQAIKKLRGKGDGGVASIRKKINKSLQELETPIVIVIDDVDRLLTKEIREIFKLVRLTASFRNIIYLVAFDRARVETALAEDGLPGRDYLEKIIQIAYDVPAIPDTAIREQCIQGIVQTLDGIENAGSLDTERWSDVFEEVIRPLIRNMRDVRRYAGSLRGSVSSLDGRVELVDVLAVEAIRVFLPDTFSAALKNQYALTTPTSDLWNASTAREDRLRAEIEELVQTGGQDEEVVRSLIGRVFPTASRFLSRNLDMGEQSNEYLKKRRLAHPDALQFYFERLAGRGLQAFWAAERAFYLLADRDGLNELFQSLPPAERAEVVQALEAYQHDYPAEAAVPATIVLINLLKGMPKRQRAVFDFFDEDTIVTRVVLRLLRRLDSTEKVESAVIESLPEIDTLSGKLQLLHLVGHEENVGQQLISIEASRDLESELRAKVRGADLGRLAAERDLFRLLTWTKATSSSDETHLSISAERSIAGAVLKSAVAETRTQGFGTRTVKTEKYLHWEVLVELLGGEGAVQSMVDACTDEIDDEDIVIARDLASKYLNGWRPEKH